MTSEQLKHLMEKYQAEQRIEEVEWFYRAVERIKPSVIVEIGIKEGGNLKILSTHLGPHGLAVGIDPRKEIPWKMQDCQCQIAHIAGSSHDNKTLAQLQALLGNKQIDVLFVDGDHSKEGMVQDFQMYSPLVRAGGIIAVHDIYYLSDVAAAWEEVSMGLKKYESNRIHSSIGIGYVIKAEPVTYPASVMVL